MDWETEFFMMVWAGQKRYHTEKQYVDDADIPIDSAVIAIDGEEQ